MLNRKLLLLIAFYMIWGSCPPVLWASSPDEVTAPEEPPAPAVPPTEEVPANKEGKLVPIPAVYYTPETQLAYGAVLMWIYPSGVEDRPSKIQPHVIYTTRNQLLVGILWEHYGKRFRYTLNPDFKKFPDNFYGIGPNSAFNDEEIYTPIAVEAFGSVDYMFTPRCSAGAGMVYERYEIVETDDEGELAKGYVPGSDRAVVTGLQARVGYDGRDNTASPFRGGFLQLTHTRYDQKFGGLWDYNHFESDFRYYLPLWEEWVLAMRLVGEQTTGEVPFRMLPGLGGVRMNRGFYEGRYRDKSLYSGQAALRFPIYGRFRGTVFYAAGAVAPDHNELTKEKPRLSGGAGLRYYLVPEDRVSLRLDIGSSADGSGVYFSLNEAF